MTDNRILESINEAVSFTLKRVSIPPYVDLDDLRQEVALVVVDNAGVEQDRVNRLAEDHISHWVQQEAAAHEITMASAEAVASHLGYEVNPSVMRNLSRKGVETLLAELTATQRKVICLRYGIGKPRCYTLPEVAAVLHISTDDTARCERYAMCQLHKLANMTLTEFLCGL